MSISEKRTQIYLTQEQHEELQKAAAERSVSMAHVVREAVATYLAEPSGVAELPRGLDAEAYLADSAWRIPEVGESFEDADWPDDAAENHDTYLYGPDRSGTAS